MLNTFYSFIILVGSMFLGSSLAGFSQVPCPDSRAVDPVSITASTQFGHSLRTQGEKSQGLDPIKAEDKGSNSADTIRIRTDLIIHDVVVTNQSGEGVSGLKKENLILTERGIPSPVELFFRGDDPCKLRSIILILDNSGEQGLSFKYSIQAALTLVDRLRPLDKMAVVTTDFRVGTPFTYDKTLLKRSLESLGAKGVEPGSGLEFDTLLAVLNEMFASDGSQRIVVFQGDGNEVIWLKQDGSFPVRFSKVVRESERYGRGERSFAYGDVVEALERSGATVYSIIPGIKFLGFSKKEQLDRARVSLEKNFAILGIGSPDPIQQKELIERFAPAAVERNSGGQTAMVRIAELSGGDSVFVERPQDIGSAYSAIFGMIEGRYSIGYYSNFEEQDVRKINTEIVVRGHPEYKVSVRSRNEVIYKKSKK